MRGIHCLLALFAGLIVSLVTGELVLRELPVTMGLYRTTLQSQWPLHAYGPHQRYSYSMTWQMLHPHRGLTNNYGQIAPFDYDVGSRPVAVVGDSFIEAMMNDYRDTLQGELGRMLGPEQPVYGFGFSGNSLAEYLAVARMATAEFAPVAMVFLIIDNDIKESWTNRLGHHYFAFEGDQVREAYMPLAGGGVTQRLRQVVGDSALYRYVQVNLGFTLDGMIAKRWPNQQTTGRVDSNAEERSRRVVDYFLEALPTASGVPPERNILVFDSDREKIYDAARQPRQGVDSANMQGYLKDRARELGYSVVDTGPIFSHHYRQHHRRFDYTPTDRHWNGLGHHVAASAVCQILRRKIDAARVASERTCDEKVNVRPVSANDNN